MRARTPLGGLISVSSVIVLGGWAVTTTAAQAEAPGNNGSIKVAQHGELDSIPNNTAHVGCVFQLEWYGFDEGSDIVSAVSFSEQAPTTGVGMSVTGPSNVSVEDGVAVYTLSFTGTPHPKQGYHVGLTVHTPRSNGADVKHKMFWVEGCASATQTPTPTPSASPTTAPTATPTPTVLGEQASDDASTETDSGTASHGEKSPALEVKGVQATAGQVEGGRVEGCQIEVPTVITAGVE